MAAASLASKTPPLTVAHRQARLCTQAQTSTTFRQSNIEPTMTSNDPDPRTFETWEDAFQYPIPAVRKFEQQLRQHAGENRQKLRNLVGYALAYGLVSAPQSC